MIFGDYTTTGDGIVSALQILRIMMEAETKPLSELKKCLSKYPQGAAQPAGARKNPGEGIERRVGAGG